MRPNQAGRVCLRTCALGILLFCGTHLARAATETLLTTQTPQYQAASDGSTTNYELGAKFTSAVAGNITAIRFWKSSRESGTHVGHVWSVSGQLLASVTFANETTSGWQQQALAAPLALNANTVYVVTVNTGNTFYVATDTGFATKIINRDLSSVVGNNGVYGPPGRFPTNTWEASNYFRDIVFSPSTSPGLTSIPVSLNLGSVNVGSSSSQTMTLTNSASTTVTISKIGTTGIGYSATGITVPMSLGSGKQVALKVTFAPSAMGTANGNVTVTSNASNPNLTMALTGVGMQPQISAVPATVAFGNVPVSVANTQTVTVNDTGNANLTITQATIGGAGFTVTGPTLPLAITPGHSAALTVRFAPTSTVASSGNLSVSSNAPKSPLLVPVSGTGVTQSAQLSATPSAVSFGNVTQGTSAKQTVTLKNTGNASLSISKLSAAGTYFSASGLVVPVTLAAGQTTSFIVTFAPTAAGSFSGSVSVVSTATNATLSISLSGSGVQNVTHHATLSWIPSTSAVSGYSVYRGAQKGGPYTRITASLVPGLSYTDSTVLSGLTYYYVVTSVAANGMESAHSSEVSATVP